MRAFARRCLLLASVFYPLFLGAQIWVRVLPAFLQHWLFGGRPPQVRWDPYFIWAGRLDSTAVQAAFVVLALPLFYRLRRRSALLAGLGLACVGLIAAADWLMPLFFRRAWSGRGAVMTVAGITLVVVGLRWAASTIPGGFWNKAGVLLAGFAAPLAFAALGRFWFGLAVAAPVAALTPLAVWRLKTAASEVHWRSVAVGAAVTALALGGMIQGRRWQEDGRDTAIAQALASLPRPAADAPFPKKYFHRGVNFTASMGGYEAEAARELLAKLPAFGVEALAIVPYGGLDAQRVRISTAGPRSWESDASVELIAASAHARGMTVLLKPQLWGAPSDTLLESGPRERWFAEYTKFIEHYARMAQRIHADTFCVGVELGKLTEFEQPWRELIARVRTIYRGPLVYAANHGREFESIRFWDALDYIGLDNYYPLGDDYSAGATLAQIEQVSARYQRPVLFTEAGYASAEGAHRTPWEDHPPRRFSLDEQVKCYEALLGAFYDKPWFAGVYWWKVETDGSSGPNDNGMSPWGKPAMESVRRWFGRPRLRVQ